MIRVFQTVADLDGDEGRRAVRTGLAFLLAPGIAAVVGGAVLVPALDGGRGSVASALGSALFFGLVGYATELVLAAPIYLVLPRRAQGAGVIVPLAGVLAAIPWLLISVRYGGAVFERVAAPIAFGLGCIGGVAFALIRGRAGDAAGEAEP